MRTRDTAKRLLIDQIEEGYRRKAWHGPNLRGALRGLSPEQAAWRPAGGRHNIWELTVHCAYWKYAVWRRLTRSKRGSFPDDGSNWFKRPLVLTAEAWHEDLRLLESMHRRLLEAVTALSERQLSRTARGSTQQTGKLLAGIAAHDIYHAGQIQMLKRIMGS